MGINIEVSTTGKEFFAGEVIKGVVNVNVDAGESVGAAAGDLVVQLVGQVVTLAKNNISVPVATASGIAPVTLRDIATETQQFLAFDITLASFGGRAMPGTHSFPFAVALPANLPSSMSEIGDSGDSCGVAYGFKARLHRPGILKFDATGKAQITVIARPQQFVATPVLAGPITQQMTKNCCFKSGSISIGFQADRTVVGRNERLGIIVVTRNDSSCSVKDMRIEIWQHSTWYANGEQASAHRIMGHVTVPGAQVGATGQGAQPVTGIVGSNSAVAQAAQRELQGLLANGAGVRHEVVIPNKCSDSMDIGIISVRHSLDIRLKTQGISNTPHVSAPLVVQRILGEGVLFGESNESAPSLRPAEAAYAAPVATVVQVPQHVVGIKMETLPDTSMSVPDTSMSVP